MQERTTNTNLLMYLGMVRSKRTRTHRVTEYDAMGKFSKVAETRKKTAYAPAKAREEARWRRKIRFIPLAFEISVGWGEEMAKFFEECVRLKKRRRSAEMYHWCAITCIRVCILVCDYEAAAERHHHPGASDGGDGGGGAGERTGQRRGPRGNLRALPRLNGL